MYTIHCQGPAGHQQHRAANARHAVLLARSLCDRQTSATITNPYGDITDSVSWWERVVATAWFESV